MKKLSIGTESALEKIKHYCSYQERNHQEVKDKLYSFGLFASQVEEILSELISENYLNEERYAIAFAGGKFRMKDWGRIKIRYELKKNKVSDYCIKKALAQIDETDYIKTAKKMITFKLNA
jgi:regulatory protein